MRNAAVLDLLLSKLTNMERELAFLCRMERKELSLGLEVRAKLWERWWLWGHKQSRELNLVIMFTPSWFGLAIGWQKDAGPSSGSGKVSHRIDANDLANHFSSLTMSTFARQFLASTLVWTEPYPTSL